MLSDASTMTDFSKDVFVKSRIGSEILHKNSNNHMLKRGPYGLLEPFQVTWKELTYRVPTKLFQAKRIILNNISGFFKSGHITAVMGPSGSSKSSFLGCISGQKKTGLSGSITISTEHQVIIKGEPTLSHCAWARTFDLVVRWKIY